MGTNHAVEGNAHLPHTSAVSFGMDDGARIAIVGAGPAGSFFAWLAMREAEKRGRGVHIILFDGKKFLSKGPKGCNMCAGVISRRLVYQLEQVGIRIPSERVQRFIRGYVFHTKAGSHSVIAPPGHGPIPVVFRGNGPRFSGDDTKISFDDFLLEEVIKKGAEIVTSHVESVYVPETADQLPTIFWSGGTVEADLVVIASGVTSLFGKQLGAPSSEYRFPKCVRAYQAELSLDDTILEKRFGNSIHVFSLGIPGIRFASMIPKRRFVTVTLVGRRDMDHEHLVTFLDSPTIRRLLPDDWRLPERYCCCRPRLPVRGAKKFYGNRLIFIGDASMSRYYKNGIDSAFQTARYGVEAVFRYGVSSRSLHKFYYVPVRREFGPENRYARVLFRLNDFVASRPLWVRAHMHTVRKGACNRTARLLYFLTWNLFTGEARYRDILRISLNPRFFLNMILSGLKCTLFDRKRTLAGHNPLQPVFFSATQPAPEPSAGARMPGKQPE